MCGQINLEIYTNTIKPLKTYFYLKDICYNNKIRENNRVSNTEF